MRVPVPSTSPAATTASAATAATAMAAGARAAATAAKVAGRLAARGTAIRLLARGTRVASATQGTVGTRTAAIEAAASGTAGTVGPGAARTVTPRALRGLVGAVACTRIVFQLAATGRRIHAAVLQRTLRLLALRIASR